MSTTNVVITSAWSQIVAAGQDFILTAPLAMHQIEVAIAATPEALATISGHVLFGAKRESINRTLIGPGIVFARIDPGLASPAAATVVLTAWVPT